MQPLSIQEEGVNELVRQVTSTVLTKGTMYKAGRSRSVHSERLFCELLNLQAVLTNARKRVFFSRVAPRIFDPGLAVARFIYMLSGSQQLEPIAFYTNSVRRFSDDGLTLPGSSYGYRIFSCQFESNQVDRVIRLIRDEPNTFRGAIAIYSSTDCGRDSFDIPCVLGMVFSPRNGFLHATLLMRANSTLRLMPYNIFEFSLLHEWIANQCNLKLGHFFHNSVSMHLSDEEIELAPRVLQEDVSTSEMHKMPSSNDDFRYTLITAEREIRQQIQRWSVEDTLNQIKNIFNSLGDYWGDLLGTLVLRGFLMTHPKRDEFHTLLNWVAPYANSLILRIAVENYCSWEPYQLENRATE